MVRILLLIHENANNSLFALCVHFSTLYCLRICNAPEKSGPSFSHSKMMHDDVTREKSYGNVHLNCCSI
ncbi:hypothetical protein KSF78_0001303 [Schistosoma japonicum]|nr:hypothetical protein KSF78_0001303 [Schistosoma japonicum]